MIYNRLGRTGWRISAMGFGGWAIGGTWGTVSDDESMESLNKAVDMGVNFFDTSDVYGDGRSEKLLARLRSMRSETIYIATKVGRKLNPHVPEGYNRENLTAFVEDSLRNLKTDALDLLQLHCPPTAVYYMPEVFSIMDDLVSAGKVQFYGVSVEKVEEALKAIEYPNVQSVQIIFNMFRQRPAELLFDQVKKRQVGIIVRVPLASGMLTGKFDQNYRFEADDHRAFNRRGEAFDRGETFSGIDFETGLKVIKEIQGICPAGVSLAQFALRWILMHDAVTCAIPGAKRKSQVEENMGAISIPPISEKLMSQVRTIYVRDLWKKVHYYW